MLPNIYVYCMFKRSLRSPHGPTKSKNRYPPIECPCFDDAKKDESLWRRRSMKEAKPANRHACPRCDSTFTRPANRDHHVHVVHENHRDHACPHCAAAFGEASHLTTHVRTVHEKRRDHACPHCTAAFGEANKLTKHVRVVHEKRRDHACPHCAAAFGRVGHLAAHVLVVHDKRRRTATRS